MAYSVGVKTTSTLAGTERVLIDNGGGPEVMTTTGAIAALANPLWTSTFATIAAASAYSPVSAPPLVWTESFDTHQVPYSGAMYRNVPTQPSHFAKFSMTLNGGATAWYEIDEDVVTPQMLGAIADVLDAPTSTLNTAAILAAIGIGRPVFIPPGVLYASVMVIPKDNVEVFGGVGSELQSSVVDGGIFYCSGHDNIHVHHLKLTGKSGSVHAAQVAPLTFINCNDLHFHDLVLTNWPDSGFIVQGTASTISRNCVIERCQVLAGQAPMRFSGACVNIGANTEDFTIRDNICEDANGGIWIITTQSVGNIHVRRHKVLNNRVARMQQYGIICYGGTEIHTITGAADNGSGLIRVAATAHGFVTGDSVAVSAIVGTTEANAAWQVTVPDVDHFDLQGSVFANAYVSGGTVVVANPADIELAGNVIEDIDGTPTAVNGNNGNFGAGIYCVGMNGIDIHDNTVRRCNQGTTSGSLAPGGIGVNGYAGSMRVVNNLVEYCGWYGITSSSAAYGILQVADNALRNNALAAIRLFDIGSWAINQNRIGAKKGAASSTGINVDATTATQKGICNDNMIVSRDCTQPLAINKTTNFEICNNVVIHEGVAATTCELVKLVGNDRGIVSGNNFDGGASPFVALTVNACTNTVIANNNIRMTEDGNARPAVSMVNTCTGTVYDRSNRSTGRMENISTGGNMHTADSVNTSGSKTRQIGDTILNTAPTAGGVSSWTKVVASAGGLNWSTLTLS